MKLTSRPAVLVLAGATAVVPALALVGTDAASASSRTHTLRITTNQLQDRIVDNVDIATDADSQHGQVTGYDVTSCRVSVRTDVARCDVAVARAHGLLYGHARVDVTTGQGSGRVTGGTRRFAHARGTIKVNGARVTITWHN
jgi:hypothetical protein